MQVSLALCGNEACTPPHRTDADGFTVTWEFTRSADVQHMNRALVLPATEATTLTAVIGDGAATATSPRLVAGTWMVCLQPVLTRSDGATVRLFDAPRCEPVSVTEDGEIAALNFALPVSVPLVIEGAADPSVTPDSSDDMTPTPGAPDPPDIATSLPNTGDGSSQRPPGTFFLILMILAAMSAAALVWMERRRYRSKQR